MRLKARLGSGETDSAYGLLLGQGNETMAVAVSPLGYVAIWKAASPESAQPAQFLLPWQTWPHVRTGDRENEILVNRDGDKISVRVNRERLWEGGEFEPIDRAGFFVASYGGEAVVDLTSVEIFAD
jgi:hypothetical protein